MEQSRILVIGGNGQLGTAFKKLYPAATFVDREEFDITNPKRYEQEDWSRYTVIINAAAYTNVDGAETAEGRRLAWAINATAVGLMVDAANEHDLTLVHVSSDYVFDGELTPHTEDEPFSPLGVYGQSKAAGDIAAMRAKKHYLVRTSWVIGGGKNFVRTMAELSAKGVAPKVVSDQLGRPTFTTDLADAIASLLQQNAPYGTYNLTNEGEVVSWAKIAEEVFKLTGSSPDQVTPITTAEYFRDKPEAAPRPLQSALDLSKITALGFKPRDWRDALAAYLRENS